jgi:hypothetical protein
MSTASVLATERSSGRVFILPTILLIALVLLVGVVLLRRRSRVSVPPAAGTPPS